MNINFAINGKPINVMIFRNDYEDRTFYTFGISKKLADGTYENGYMNCQFRKEIELENKTKIHPKEAWLTFYKNKSGITVPYVFINNFEYASDDYDSDLTEEVDLDDLDNLLE